MVTGVSGQAVVVPQLVEFATDDRQVIDLQAGSVPVPTIPGVLDVDVPFTSDVLDPLSGEHLAGRIGFTWSLERSVDGVRAHLLPDGIWFGRHVSNGPQEIASFDSITGDGVVRVRIPLGTSMGPSFPSYPGLPSGSARLHLALDWLDELEFALDGSPQAAEWVGTVDLVAAAPPVSIEMGRRQVAIGESVFAEVVFDPPLPAPALIGVQAVPDHVVEIEPAAIQMPAGTEVTLVEVVGVDLGSFRLTVSIDEVASATSQRREVIDPVRFASAATAPSASGAPDLNTGILKKCSPPSALGGVAGLQRGPCTVQGTPQIVCLDDVGGVKDAYCYRAFTTACVAGPDTTVTTGSFDASPDSPFIEDCSFGGGITFGGVLGGEITVQPKRACCRYLLNPDAPEKQIGVHTCSS